MRFDKQSDKCGYVIFAKQHRPDQEVYFGDQLLKRKRSHKYLGVLFNESLKFPEHIAQVRAKAW